jgi:small multidrug resistance pump
MGYAYMILAILLEVAGTVCMKLSDGFSDLRFAAGTAVCYVLCFYFFGMCLKTVELGIAYATWGGLGIVLLSLLSYFYFHESITMAGLIGIAFILVGVVLCNLFGIDRG